MVCGRDSEATENTRGVPFSMIIFREWNCMWLPFDDQGGTPMNMITNKAEAMVRTGTSGY